MVMPQWEDTLAMIERMRTPQPPKGTAENPYDLVVPGWYEDMCHEQGETVEQVAERVFMPGLHVNISVVR